MGREIIASCQAFHCSGRDHRGLVASMQTQVVLNEGLVVERKADRISLSGIWEIYELTRESLERAIAIGYEILSLDHTSSQGHQLVALGAYHLVLMGLPICQIDCGTRPSGRLARPYDTTRRTSIRNGPLEWFSEVCWVVMRRRSRLS